MKPSSIKVFATSAFVALVFLPAFSQAQLRRIQVTAENLAPTNSVSFAPLRVGFNNGSYDSFNIGQTATAPIISIAEGGSGSDWFPAFAAADPNATLGTVVPNPPGPLLPSGMASALFDIDTDINPFFTFGSMVVPSNDYFIGNDDPQEYQLFDVAGNLILNEINVLANEIWDNGSEAFDPANAAFLVGGTNALRTPQNGVVNFDFAELAGFNGLTTGAGYVFNSQLTANTPVYRIRFTVVAIPEPGTAALVGVGMLGMVLRRRRRA